MNNILWQQNSCPCNEYSAEAGWPANRRSRLMETRTQINHLREEIVHQIKLLITWVILVSLQIFHVFIIHKILIIEIKKCLHVYEMKGRQLLPAGYLA